MNRTNAFVKGFLSTTTQKILTRIIGLFVTPIVLTYLDKTEYGIWIIIGSFLGYMGLMDFGITGATSAVIAKNNTKEQELEINKIINNAFFLQCIIGAVILVVGFIFSFYFPDVFNLENYSKDDAWIVLVFAIIGYAISFPPKSLKGLIRAKQHISLAVWIEFTLFVMTTILNLTLLELGFGLMALPLGTIAIRLLSYPIFIHYAKKIYPSLSFKLSLVRKEDIKSLFNVSIWWFLSILAAIVIYSTDTILIGMFLSASLVTVYALTFRLHEVVREWIYSITFTLMPGIGQLFGENNIEKIKEVYFKSQIVILSLSIYFGFLIYMYNGSFVSLWVGKEYYVGDNLSLIFALMLFITVVFHSSSVVLSADLKLKNITYVRITEATLNIILSIILIKEYELLGIAFATLISGVLTSFWIVPLMTIKRLGISLSEWFKKIVIKVLFILALLYMAYVGMEVIISTTTFMKIVKFILFNIFSLSVIWFVAFDKDTKEKVYAKIR